MKVPFKAGHCTTCMKQLNGRSDKVYCDITCKNALHEISRKFTKHIQKHINQNVIRNYILCEGMMRETGKKIIAHRDLLFKYGFDIHAFDKKYKRKSGVIYRILEYRCRFKSNGMIEIWRTKRTVEYPEEFLRRYEREFSADLSRLVMENDFDNKDEVEEGDGEKLKWIFYRVTNFVCSSLTAKAFIYDRSEEFFYTPPS